MTDRAGMAMMVQRPLRIRLLLLPAAAGVLAGLAWYIGMDLWHACVIAAVVLALGLLWLTVPDSPPGVWPREESAKDEGTRHDVTRLSWSLRTRRGRVRADALTRIRLLSAGRLAPYGIDMDDAHDRDALVRLIGERAYRTLRPTPQRLPYFHDIERCLDALSGLVPPDSGIPDPPARPAATAPIDRVTAGMSRAIVEVLTRRSSR
jgi:phage shock protein PspC (stress-responsive transcriptional regulator)